MRLEVQNLNRTLNEDIGSIRKLHTRRRNEMRAMFSDAGRVGSGAYEEHEAEWANDGVKLDAAIKQLEPKKRTFDDLDDHQLESKLMDLRSIERVFQQERSKGAEWQNERDRSHKFAMDAQAKYR